MVKKKKDDLNRDDGDKESSLKSQAKYKQKKKSDLLLLQSDLNCMVATVVNKNVFSGNIYIENDIILN